MELRCQLWRNARRIYSQLQSAFRQPGRSNHNNGDRPHSDDNGTNPRFCLYGINHDLLHRWRRKSLHLHIQHADIALSRVGHHRYGRQLKPHGNLCRWNTGNLHHQCHASQWSIQLQLLQPPHTPFRNPHRATGNHLFQWHRFPVCRNNPDGLQDKLHHLYVPHHHDRMRQLRKPSRPGVGL